MHIVHILVVTPAQAGDEARLALAFMTACMLYFVILWLALMYLGNHHDCNAPRLLHYSASFYSSVEFLCICLTVRPPVH